MTGHGWSPERLDTLPPGTVVRLTALFAESMGSMLLMRSEAATGGWLDGGAWWSSADLIEAGGRIDLVALPLDLLREVLADACIDQYLKRGA